ncbi:MAG: hypothetical protein ACRCX4_06960 [Bacteroidales bacterium]
MPFASTINLNCEAYAGSDNTLSITESFNKITVTNSLYEVKELYPKFDTSGATMIKETEVIHKDRRIKRRYYDSPKFFTWKYLPAVMGGLYGTTAVSNNPEHDLGAYVVKMVDFAHSENVNSLQWDTTLHVRMNNEHRLPLDFKLMEKKINVESFAKSGFWASLDFNIRCSTTDTGYNSKISTLSHSDTKGSIIVPVQIRCGDKYYSENKLSPWTNQPTTLLIKCGEMGPSVEMTDTWYAVQDGNTWQNLTPNLNGFMINFNNQYQEGELDIIFFTPYLWNNSKNHGYDRPITEPYHRDSEVRYYQLKDINVKFQIPSEEAYAGDEDEKDRIYEEVISDSFTGSDYNIDLMLSTNQSDSVNRSNVILMGPVNSLFTGYVINGTTIIPEQLIIDRHRLQLSKPRKKLDINIRYDDVFNRYYDKHTNATYIPIGIEHDTRYGSSHMSLIELHINQ